MKRISTLQRFFPRNSSSERIISWLWRTLTFLKSKRDLLPHPLLEQTFQPFTFSLSLTTQDKPGITALRKQCRTTQSLATSRCVGGGHLLGETMAPRQLHCKSHFTMICCLLAFSHPGILILLQAVSRLIGIIEQCFIKLKPSHWRQGELAGVQSEQVHISYTTKLH